LYSQSFDAVSISGVLSLPDESSESSEEVDSGSNWKVLACVTCGEHGVHVTEGFDKSLPMTPITLPFVGICSHDPSVDVNPCSSEKISIVSLLLNQKSFQEFACG
jgi:hypothetical protein